MSKSRLLATWVLCGIALAAGSVGTASEISPQFRATSWRTTNGLPHSSVSALFQDSDGYLWVGTYLGAARFDGVRFLPLTELSGDDAAIDLVESIGQTPDGMLWFGGAYHGLMRLDRKGQLTRFDEHNGLPPASITLLQPHPEGGLWLGTGAGLFHARFGDTQVESLQLDLAQTVWALAQDADGNLYAATENGPWRRTTDGWQLASHDPQIARAHVWSIAFDAAGRGYAGFRGGMAELGSTGFELSPLAAALPTPIVRQILPDPDGVLWIATSGSGVHAVHKGNRIDFSRQQGLAGDTIWELMRDREGVLWAGTTAGLSRIGRSKVQMLGVAEDVPPVFAWAIARRRAGGWWLGFNDGGLIAFDGNRRVALAEARDSPAAAQAVLSVLDQGQYQWVGTVGGLFRRDTEGRMQAHPDFVGRRIQSLYALAGEGVLVGTNAGLWRLHDGQAETVEMPGVAEPSISRVRADGPGKWLIAVPNSGLYGYDGVRAERIIEMPGMKLRDALRTPDGRLWLAAVGLHVLDGGVLQPISAVNRVLPVQFHALERDAQGRIWSSTNAGILRLEPAELDRYLADPAAAPDFMLFGEAEGMSSSECNGSTQNALLVDDEGAVWAGTAEGVVRIPGDADRLVAAMPKPRIERIIVDGATQAMGADLRVAPGARQIAIDYTALRLADAERLRFRYRLQPVVDVWSEVGARRRASFDALTPGKYRFEVAVGTAADPWGEPVAVSFEVVPYWWQSTSLRALVVLSLLGFIAVAIWLRMRELRERERALKLLVQERTQELEQANVALARAASRDFLTGLPNRRAFVQSLDLAFAESAPLALAMLDIDYFKAYNDQLGHPAGDQCLKQFGELLASHAVASGIQAARMGGEEFAMIFSDDAAQTAQFTLEAVARDLAARAIAHPASSVDACLTFSAGLARRTIEDADGEALMRRADAALYRAKEQGRNRCVLAS